MSGEFRVGIGYDSHRLVENRKFIVGGVEIPFEKGLSGHSDGDILFHALTDALLGAVGLGDIGEHFPPSDTKWKDAASRIFLEHAHKLIQENGYRVVNVDAVIIVEQPKIGPWRDAIRKSVAEVLGIEMERVGLKAKTAEGMGPVGEGLAAEAQAVALLARG
ncbi:MAG: 2-C-methyl-D-erythritol 2,4-cyclodiphosphate synthase [Acidobacteria bacterium]|nr:2-C-methyl-D-erythritol 2,4-cyclodiphosphate synthase [Acidobacteriota bacterium]